MTQLLELVSSARVKIEPSPTETVSARSSDALSPSASCISIASAETISSGDQSDCSDGGWMELGGESPCSEGDGCSDDRSARPKFHAVRSKAKKLKAQNRDLDSLRARLVDVGWETRWSVRQKGPGGGFWTYRAPDGTVFRSVKTLRKCYPGLF